MRVRGLHVAPCALLDGPDETLESHVIGIVDAIGAGFDGDFLKSSSQVPRLEENGYFLQGVLFAEVEGKGGILPIPHVPSRITAIRGRKHAIHQQ